MKKARKIRAGKHTDNVGGELVAWAGFEPATFRLWYTYVHYDVDLCRFIPLIDGLPFCLTGTKGNDSARKLSPFVTT
jgi:hypothetical protein